LKKNYVKEAVQNLGMNEKEASRLTKYELCRRLGHVPAQLFNKEKICTMKRINERYSRTELEFIALSRGVSLKDIRNMNYYELCKFLNIPFPAILEKKKKPEKTVSHKQSKEKTVSHKQSKENCIRRSLKKLKDYQENVIRHFEKNNSLIVWHKMGSGKTLTAIAVSQCYLDKYPDHKVIVIAPSGLINNFKNEMKNSYGYIHHSDRYEFYSYQKFTTESKKRKVSCKNALVIVDEAHNLRTLPSISKKTNKLVSGINTYHILNCANASHKKLLLTATPFYNSEKDIISLYNMIRNPNEPELKNMDKTTLKKLKCMVSYHSFGKNDENFPKPIHHDVYIPMHPSYEKRYRELIKTIYEKNEDDLPSIFSTLFGEKNLAVFLNAIRRGTNNLYKSLSENAKIDWIINKIKTTPSNERMVIYSGFLSAGMNIIIDKLPKNKTFAFITGKIKPADRYKIIQDYNNGKIQILFISKAGGEGLNLMETRHIILLEPSWNISSEDQITARAIRYKSHENLPPEERNVHIYKLYHVFNDDLKLLNNVKKYLVQVKENPYSKLEIPLSITTNSCDLYLKTFMDKKQLKLDAYNEELIGLSIEKNKC